MKKLVKHNLIRLALIVGGMAVATKLIAAKRSEWQGLSESEVRSKLVTRLPDRVPEQKRAAVADKVVATMRDCGLLAEEIDESAQEVAEEVDSEATAEASSTDSADQGTSN